MKITTSTLTLVASAAIAGVLWLGCAVSRSVAFEEPSPGVGPAFTEPDAAPPPEADTPMCISYECPAPYATCLDNPGLCTTYLKTDVNNCGECGKKCDPDGGALRNDSFRCIDGECHLQCPPYFDFDDARGDCNGQLEDGCEARLAVDPANCGACGNACKEGEICWKAACGCPSGFEQCGNDCKQLDRDTKNCSACGRACGLPDGTLSDEDVRAWCRKECGSPNVDAGAWPCAEGVLPAYLGPRCVSSSCVIGCEKGMYDCNGDLCSDGCETYLQRDPKNCGACGHACLPEQTCVKGICQCADPALVYCTGDCVDLMKDPSSCGSCNNVCPGARNGNGHPMCEFGRCSYHCRLGRGDCDGRIDNGCEVDLMVDPLNCGGCGVQCDIENGQPCAAGRCLTKPCDVPDAGGVF